MTSLTEMSPINSRGGHHRNGNGQEPERNKKEEPRSNDSLLFDERWLWNLDYDLAPGHSHIKSNYNFTDSYENKPWVRPLSPSDYDKGFDELLGQLLTKTGKPTKKQFLETFAKMQSCPDTYYVTVIEDKGKIIGAATLFVEHKFIHACAKRGHLEDVVGNSTNYGKQLDDLIVIMALLAQLLDCYKMSFDSKVNLKPLIPLYKNLGFEKEPGYAMFQRSSYSPAPF